MEIKRSAPIVPLLCHPGQHPVEKAIALVQDSHTLGLRLHVHRTEPWLEQMCPQHRLNVVVGSISEDGRHSEDEDPDNVCRLADG